jgi:hypothetical protein
VSGRNFEVDDGIAWQFADRPDASYQIVDASDVSPQSGRESLRLGITVAEPNDSFVISQTIELTAGAPYRLSVWARSTSACRVVYGLEEGEAYPFATSFDQDPVLVDAWTQYTSTFTAPLGADSIYLAIGMSCSTLGPAEIHLDAVTVTPIEPTCSPYTVPCFVGEAGYEVGVSVVNVNPGWFAEYFTEDPILPPGEMGIYFGGIFAASTDHELVEADFYLTKWTPYQFSFWARTNPGCRIVYSPNYDDVYPFATSIEQDPASVDQWTRYTTTFTSTMDIAFIQLGFTCSNPGKGEMWLYKPEITPLQLTCPANEDSTPQADA